MVHSLRTAAFMLVALGLGVSGAGAQEEALETPVANAIDATFCQQTLHGQLWARTELYFGLSRPDGRDVTDDQFEHFLDTEVTPRFPDGLTLLTGDGQFRGSSGVVVKERSKLLILFYPWSAGRSRAIQRIRSIYKQEFHQESVLRVDDQSCVSF
jgi:hypothetical protein